MAEAQNVWKILFLWVAFMKYSMWQWLLDDSYRNLTWTVICQTILFIMTKIIDVCYFIIYIQNVGIYVKKRCNISKDLFKYMNNRRIYRQYHPVLVFNKLTKRVPYFKNYLPSKWRINLLVSKFVKYYMAKSIKSSADFNVCGKNWFLEG